MPDWLLIFLSGLLVAWSGYNLGEKRGQLKILKMLQKDLDAQILKNNERNKDSL